MRKKLVIINPFLLIVITQFLLLAIFFLAGCKPVVKEPGTRSPLYNQSLNEQLDELADKNLSGLDASLLHSDGFYFNYTPRAEARYEVAKDDVFTLSMGSFKSTEISFLGVMLGDSYESVVERLGIPDTFFIPADKSYINLDYMRKIGIPGSSPAITLHFENNTLIRITVKPSFQKYLQGNMSIGTPKAIIYYLLDVPDYQDFVANLKAFHYVEKGVDIYFKADKIDRMSFYMPREFKGVKYVTVVKEIDKGVFVNVTEAVLIE